MAGETDLGPTGGTVWSSPVEWASRRTPEGCVICRAGKPLNIIAEFGTCWATAGREEALPGYVCVVAKGHYNEPFEMPQQDQGRFWQEAMAVAAAVNRVVAPIKMNYEIHGNTLPHLHLHLFPRHPDDPYVGGPVDPRKASFIRTEEELERLAEAVRSSQ